MDTCPVVHTAAPAQWDESRVGKRANWAGARRVSWFIRYGLPRVGLGFSARRGDLIAQMTTEPALRADPYSGYEQLREMGPLVKGRVTFATVDHAIAREVLRSPVFHAGTDLGPLPPKVTRFGASFTDPLDLGPVDAPSMLAVNGDLHLRYRRLVTRAFAAKNVAQQEDRVREITGGLLDDLARDGNSDFDLVARFAGQLPVQVIADMLGVDAVDRDRLLHWGDGAALMLDPDLSWKQYQHATDGLHQLHTWVLQQLARLRREPNDTLLGRLAAMDGEDALSDVELRMIAMLVLGAGFETTVNLIANAAVLLDEHPDQRQIAMSSGNWANVVEESFRYEPPVQVTVRTATTETEVAGQTVKAGQTVLTMLGGANRDPKVFEDPQRFDVTRANADAHLSLSDGPHYCLGANLAKLEGRVALEMLYERFPNVKVLPGGQRRTNRVLRGWAQLPVSV